MSQSIIEFDPDMQDYQRKEDQKRADLFCAVINYFMTERARREAPENGMGINLGVNSNLHPPTQPTNDYEEPTPIPEKKVKKKKKKKPTSVTKIVKKKSKKKLSKKKKKEKQQMIEKAIKEGILLY